MVAAAGGLVTYQAVKRGTKLLERLQSGQEASEEFERESLLARRSEVERLMEEGVDVGEESELTPLLQRQEATDELLDTFRFGEPVEPISSGVELPGRNVRVSEPAQLDAPPSSLQTLREEMAESLYDEPPLKQTQQLIKDNELDRRIAKQKPVMEDVDLTPEVELTPEEEEALQREMETDRLLDPESDLDKMRKEISDDLGIEDVVEPDEFPGSIMSPVETASEYGLPVEYYKAIDRGDVKAAENILKGLKEPTGLDAGNPTFQTIKSTELDVKGEEALRLAKTGTEVAGEAGIAAEAAVALTDPLAALGIAAIELGIFEGVMKYAVDPALDWARKEVAGENTRYFDIEQNADTEIHQVTTEAERQFWVNYVDNLVAQENRYEYLSQEQMDAMSPQERRRFNNDKNKLNAQRLRAARTFEETSLDKDIIQVTIQRDEQGKSYPTFSVREKPTGKPNPTTAALIQAEMDAYDARNKPMQPQVEETLQEISRPPLSYEEKQAAFNNQAPSTSRRFGSTMSYEDKQAAFNTNE